MKRWIAIIGAFLMVNTAFAQEATVRKVTNFSIATRSEFRSLNNNGSIVSQLSIPLAMKLSVTRNLALDILSTAIVSSVEDDLLAGPRDLKARAVMMFADDTVMLNAGVSVPLGESALDQEQLSVSAMLADRRMRFRYANLGEGFDVSVNGGVAQQFGLVVLGAGGGYIKKGEYVLSEDPEREYLPGDQITAVAGADVASGPLLVRLDGTYVAYQPDKQDGRQVYQEDDKIAVQGIALVRTPYIHLLMSGRYTIRRDEGLFQSNLLADSASLYGNQVDAKAYLRFPLNDRFSMSLLGDFSMIQKNDSDLNDSQLFGFGGGMTFWNALLSSYLSLEGRYYIGTAENGESDLDGFGGVCSIYISF